MTAPRALLTPPVGPRDHVLGPADARVTLVEYGDFECPFCGAAYPELQRALRELGPKVRFVFRHFPLAEQHPHAPRPRKRPKPRPRRASSGRCTTCCISVRRRSTTSTSWAT